MRNRATCIASRRPMSVSLSQSAPPTTSAETQQQHQADEEFVAPLHADIPATGPPVQVGRPPLDELPHDRIVRGRISSMVPT